MHDYGQLTAFIPEIRQDTFGKRHTDSTADGSREHPYTFPFVLYSDAVNRFTEAMYKYMDAHPDYGLNRYYDILSANGIEWDMNSMSVADVSRMDAQCVLALLVGAIRAERFCDGALLEFFENGCMLRWLERLEEIDKKQGSEAF